MHKNKLHALYKEHRASFNFKALTHVLKGSDDRLVSLDKQVSLRLFRKRKADLNELHMARTLEEAIFLETMMNSLDKVQDCKEDAARGE